MFEQYELQQVILKNSKNFNEVKDFLAHFALVFDKKVDYTVVLRDKETNSIVGTGSFSGEILRNFALSPNIQGEGLASSIISALMQEQARQNIYHHFVFTKPEKAKLFSGLGFKEIAKVEPYASLLESGITSISSYCQTIKEKTNKVSNVHAGIVVNCNPFTKGHRALIETAAKENASVIVFVVSEDKSLFPFAVRLRLVQEGVADLKNVTVVAGGSYVISAATFPTYFTREEEQVVAQTKLDITLFAKQIAPMLNINRRYAGEEPYCQTTAAYNQAMLDILPKHGIEVKIIQRSKNNEEIISASKVRELLKNAEVSSVKDFVPQTTYAFLNSVEAQLLIEKIKTTNSRH